MKKRTIFGTQEVRNALREVHSIKVKPTSEIKKCICHTLQYYKEFTLYYRFGQDFVAYRFGCTNKTRTRLLYARSSMDCTR